MTPPTAITESQVEAVTDTSAVVIPDPLVGMSDVHPIFTIDDVLPHRQRSAPIAPGVAAFASSDMFKSKGSLTKPKARDFHHRVSHESASRSASSLKGAMKHFRPEMISLCGGLPSSDYFPFEQIHIKMPVSPAFSETETAVSGQKFSAGKHDVLTQKSLYDLSIALNYGQSMGPPQLVRFVTEHTEVVHNPPYSDWDICMTAGSTSALEIALRLFTEKGHYMMTEEYSFSTAIETISPLGVKLLGIKMDEHGMLPNDLDHILSNWDSTARRAPKPFLVYTVPTGQNPTSATQPLSRRKAIYAVAEKHDLIILEDEPYYFLQMEPYISGEIHSPPRAFEPAPISTFLSSLIPSFLSLDTSGRVLRLDSFSKIIAPGCRCGWVTGSTQLIERFIRHNEVTAQNPSGFSEIVLYKLLEENWGHKGFLEWLMFIRAEYTRRRDVIVSACERYLPAEVASWCPPRAGMFHWIRIDARKHPRFVSRATDTAGAEERKKEAGEWDVDHTTFLELEEDVFMAGVTEGVLLARGSWFRAQKGSDKELFLRTTFAAASEEKIVEAVKRLGCALRAEFRLTSEAAAEHSALEGKGHGKNGHINGHGNRS